MARLKTFAWSDGMRTYAVATTSREKALAAWGIRQDLFKEGVAKEVDDEALIAAASAQPGVVVAQPVQGGAVKAIAAAKAPPKPTGPSAVERQVAKLKEEIAALEQRHAQDLDAIGERRRIIDGEEAELEAAFRGEREALASKLAAAKKGL